MTNEFLRLKTSRKSKSRKVSQVKELEASQAYHAGVFKNWSRGKSSPSSSNMVRSQLEIWMLLKMQTQGKEKTQERSKCLQSQRKRLNGIFGEKLRSKRSQANSNHAKIEKKSEKIKFKKARVLSLVLLIGIICLCTLLKLIKNLILIICLIISHSHLFLTGGSHDIIWGT